MGTEITRFIQRFPRKIWEVKPISSIFLAEAQLARYTTGHLRNDDKLLQVGEAGRFSGQFTINVYDETFLVPYCTPKAGVITYSVTAANYQSNPNYVYTPQKIKVKPYKKEKERERYSPPPVPAPEFSTSCLLVVGLCPSGYAPSFSGGRTYYGGSLEPWLLICR